MKQPLPTVLNAPLSKITTFKKLSVALLMLLLLVFGSEVTNAQTISATTYPFTKTSGAALEDLTSGATQLLPAASDDGVSAIANIGFDFYYVGTRYTSFGVSANGELKLGGVLTSGSSDYSNAFATGSNVPNIAPYWDDLWVGSNGIVQYKVIGSTPGTRKLVVEWKNMTIPRTSSSTTGAGNFQVWLWESTGVIDFVYGAGMVTNTTNGGASIGLGSSTTVYASVTLTATSTSSTVAYGTANNANSIPITSGTKFTFIPLVGVAPTGLNFTSVTSTGMTLNWSAASPTTGILKYAIYNSSDGITYNYVNTTTLGTNSLVVSSLIANTTYYWKVYSLSEGALSTALSANATTCLATPAAPTASSITNTGFTANWVAVTGATGYSLEVSTNSGFTAPISGSPFTTTLTTNALTGLISGNTYYYRVTATGSGCNSVASTSASTPLVCTAPTSLAATANSTSQTYTSIVGAFTAATTAPTGYLVVRTITNVQPTPATGTVYTTGSNAIGYIDYVSTTAGTWTSSGLTAGTTYYYWVFSYNNTSCTGPVYSTSATSFTQSTITCPTFASTIAINGATAVAGTSYPTLTAAIADMKVCGISQPTVLELTSAYLASAETFPITLSAITGVSATNTITIREASGVTGKSITTTNATATFDFNGGNYWIIDGRPGGAGTRDLAIGNTGAAPAIRFINEGSNNTVKYVTITSSVVSTTSGLVVFSTTTGSNGNDNNTIDNCDLNGGSTAGNIIYASGTTTTTATNNSGITISNNLIRDFFLAASADWGINISTGNTDWTISNNNIYQTASRTQTTGTTEGAINISNSSGNNFNITGNNIGGGAINCGGTAWTVAGSVANRFRALSLAVGTTTASSIQGNTIANINFTSSSGASTVGGPWCGIYMNAGNANIGDITGNTIGSASGTGSISASTTTTGGISNGIFVETTTGTVTISNNTIGSINVTGSSVSILHGFTGISTAAVTNLAINNNLIGSTSAANSINAINAGTATTLQTVTGILNAATGTVAITNNTIANLNNAYVPTTTVTTSSVLRGIVSSTGTNTITGNTIRNLSTSANASGTTSAIGVIGISMTSTTGLSTVSNNSIYAIANTNSVAAVQVAGIYFAGGATNNIIARNSIYNLGTSYFGATIYGIYANAGTSSFNNNSIRLGYDTIGVAITLGAKFYGLYDGTGTNNYYHNTVYIGGTGVLTDGGNFSTAAFYSTVTTGTRANQNNIFINNRSNSTNTGKHYAEYLSGMTGLTNNYNIYLATGTGGILGFLTTDKTTLSAWQIATTQDIASFNNDPQLIDPTGTTPNLHINTSNATVAEGTGILIALVTEDFDGQTRSGLTPIDIGADAGNFIGAAPILSNMSANPTITTQCTKASRVISIDISSASGTITGATLNYSHNGTAQTAVAMTNSSGSTWTGTILAPSIGNATVTWSIVGTNSIGFSTTYIGTSYADEPNTGILTSAIASPSTICNGSSSSLSASFNTIASGTARVGTRLSTTSSTSQPTAFCNRWSSYQSQTIYTAADLTAAGLRAGNITSMAYDITSLGDASTNASFTVKISTTTSTDFGTSTSFVSTSSGFTTVYPAATYTHTASGLQTITFSTPFAWDGTSNIIIDVTHSGANATNNSITYYTATTGNTTLNSYNGATIATPSTQRLDLVFTGQKFTPITPTAYSWSDGTNTLGTINPLSTAITSGLTYTATATVNGCPMTAAVTPTVNPLPSGPVANIASSSQCVASAIPTVSVSGTSAQMRWYNGNTSNATLLQTGGLTYTSSISSSQTFYVGINNGTCETAPADRTALSVTVTIPNAISATAVASPICLGQSITLTATNTASSPTQNYSYSWVCDTTGSGATIANANNPASFTPTAAGSFTYTVTGTDGICSAVNTVSVTVNALPVITTATALPSTVCSGATIALTGSSIQTNAGFVTIGSGTDTTTLSTDGTPYRTGNTIGNQFKNQFLILASELTSAGITAGNITSLKLYVSGSGGGTLSNLTVSMANSSLTAMTTTYVTGLTQVYSIATWPSTGTLTTGLQTHTFNTPFAWNGTSNIVIQVCAQLASSGIDGTLRGTATPFVSHILNNASSTGCSTTSSTTSSVRPNIILGGQVSSDLTTSYSWLWNSTPVIATATGTTNETNTSASTITKTYTVTATNTTTGCNNSVTTSAITINPVMAAGTASSAPTLCISTPLTAITHTTTSATGIGTATGLPAGVTAAWVSNTITISGTPTVSGTFNYTIPLTGGCGSVNATGTISITATITTSIASANPTLCINTILTDITRTTTGATGIGAAIGLPAGVSATWASNTLTISGTPTAGGIFNYSIPLIGGCGSVNATGTITVTSDKTWLGTTDNSWNTASNWSCGTVPLSTETIVISSGSPVLDTNFTVGSTGSLTISGTGTLTINPTKVLTTSGTTDFGGKSVTLKSDATGTGTIGQVTGTLVGASNVTVERSIPFGKRAFRLLTPSVTTTSTIYNNWQISGATTAGRGTHITGSTSGANGFDTTASGNPSMFTYENNVASGTGWLAIPNTDVTTLTAGMGYRTLVRGDRNVDISVASTDNMNVATTLAATGTLKVGNVIFNSSSTPALNNTISTSSNPTTNDFSLIGNPYASPVDWSLVTKVNVGDTYYTWDPNMGTAAQRGRYVAYDITTGRDIPESAVSQYIQPGQAFFVKTTAASPVLTFKEADKATSFTNVFRTNEMNSRLSISVYNPTEVAFAAPIDGTTAVFGADFNATIGVGDVEKLFTAGESLAWSRGAKLLAIDALAPVVANDELHLKTMQFAANKSYTFKINATNFDNTLTAFLVDQYLNTQTQVDLTAPNFVTFATTTDTASYGTDRFKVVFSPSSALNNAEWNSKSLRIYPNPVVDNQFTIAVSPSITDKVMITIYNMIGQSVYKENAAAINNAILVRPSALLKAGVYMVEMVNKGKTSTQKIIIK